MRLRGGIALLTLFCLAVAARGAGCDALFLEGVDAYRANDYTRAADAFRDSARLQPASGTLQNLGNAEWQRGKAGAAIRAWEQAVWLDPFNATAREDLRYARKAAQVDSPELTWCEVVSSWLPVNWWGWITGGSLWLATGMTLLPGILRQRKAAWHQALAALGLTAFLLSVPAQLGVHTRSRIGFALGKDTALRLTPTQDAQTVARLPGGKPARCERTRGNFVLIRTSPDGARGWVTREEFGLICPE